VGAARAFRVARAPLKLHQILHFRVTFDASHQPHHNGEAHVRGRDTEKC